MQFVCILIGSSWIRQEGRDRLEVEGVLFAYSIGRGSSRTFLFEVFVWSMLSSYQSLPLVNEKLSELVTHDSLWTTTPEPAVRVPLASFYLNCHTQEAGSFALPCW